MSYRIGFPFLLLGLGGLISFLLCAPFGYTVWGHMTGSIAYAVPITAIFGAVFFIRSRGRENLYRYSVKYAAFYIPLITFMAFTEGRHGG